MKAILPLLSLLVCLMGCQKWISPLQEVSSPDGRVRVQVGLGKAGQPYYRVSVHQQWVMDSSWLGFTLVDLPDLREGFEIIDVARSQHDETWEQPWGEEQFIRNHYEEMRVHLREQDNGRREMILVFRVFEDGVGFRYEFPEQENLRHFAIMDELTEFHMVADHEAWWIPAMEANRYEYLYQHTALSEMPVVHTPVTFQTKGGLCISLHEAALADYSSMVVNAAKGTRLQADLVPYSRDEQGCAFVSAPGHTPWRTIQLADRPGDLITSYLILNLNDPNQLGDVSWVKPGKYVGIWWAMHIGLGTWAPGAQHAATTANTKQYIDFAADHGFDGVLVEGWNRGWEHNWVENGDVFSFTESFPDFDLAALSQYAESRGVYLVGHHETSGNVDHYEQQMVDAYALLQAHGVKAVKTGYVEHGNLLSNGKFHHGQFYIDHFRKVIQLAAHHRIAIVAHEPIKDTGERRTFPNIVSREGARGQEFNAWSPDGGNPPNHQCIMPFTRYLAGPMDFTPGVFDLEISQRPDNRVQTTLAKQLALYVTIYSPMQMACDLPAHYQRHPEAFQFIKDVGVDWETTQVLDAEIGQHLTVARKERNTGDWFVGAITNEDPRSISLDLDFLTDGVTYEATIYRDADDAHYQDNPTAHVIEHRQVRRGDRIEAALAASGGLAISFHRSRSKMASDP